MPKGGRFQALIYSIETLIRDAVSIRFCRSRRTYASIQKGAGYYSRSTYNNHLSFRIHIKLAYEGMLAAGYLEEVKRGVSHGPVGLYLTRYRATEKLMRHFRQVDVATLPLVTGPRVVQQIIRVQVTENTTDRNTGRPSKVKRLVNYNETAETQQMRARLQRINNAINANWIDLELSDEGFLALQARMRSRPDAWEEQEQQLDLTRTTLYRVFNDTEFRTGGRFYGGWWQNIPSEARPLITINGKPTVELDFSNLHPAILYAERGLEPPDDAYTNILPELPRKIAKIAFNAMLSAKKPLQRQPSSLKLSEYNVRWQGVVEGILERHHKIADAFFSNAGSRLQRLDSDLAERVMLSFADYAAPVPVLPVHDSFIVHHGYENELREYMSQHFADMFGMEIQLNMDLRAQSRGVQPIAGEDFWDALCNPTGAEKRLGVFFNNRNGG